MKRSRVILLLILLVPFLAQADACKVGTLTDIDRNTCSIAGVDFQFGMLSFGMIDGRNVPYTGSMARPLSFEMIRFEPHGYGGHVGFTLTGFPTATVTTAYTDQLVWLFLPLVIQPDSTSTITVGDITADYTNSVYSDSGSTAKASGTLSVEGYVYAESNSATVSRQCCINGTLISSYCTNCPGSLSHCASIWFKRL